VVFVALEGETAAGFTELYPLFSSVSTCRLWVLTTCSCPQRRGDGAPGGGPKVRRGDRGEEAHAGDGVNNLPAQLLYKRMGWKKDETFYYYHLDV